MATCLVCFPFAFSFMSLKISGYVWKTSSRSYFEITFKRQNDLARTEKFLGLPLKVATSPT